MARALHTPLAVSLGDPAGIGPEVIAKCWDNRSAFALPLFVAIGDPRSLAAVWDGPIEVVDDPRQADAAFDYGLPLIQINAPESDMPGHPSVAGAHTSLDSLEIAVGLARSGSARAWCTRRSPMSGLSSKAADGYPRPSPPTVSSPARRLNVESMSTR